MPLVFELIVSAAILIGVLWFMWRLPRKGEALYGWAPGMALASAWLGLLAVTGSAALWVLPAADVCLVLLFLGVDPACLAVGVLTLWIYRGASAEKETLRAQRLQAWVGIGLGLAAVALGYVFVLTHKRPFTPVGL